MPRQLQAPSPSPPRPPPTPTLPAQINAATRNVHHKLNRLITKRLPLALPPHATTPQLYATGIAPFAEIYFMFEHVWGSLDSWGNAGMIKLAHDHEVRQWLQALCVPGLERSPRLKRDLRSLSRIGCTSTTGNTVLENTHFRRMLTRMREDLRQKPHLLVAYGWVMYMAMFSGGRWIRQQFVTSGPGFWQTAIKQDPLDAKLATSFAGFSFLSFAGDQDGEDIKTQFKLWLAEAETLLSPQERQDVVDASQQLFHDCIDIVGQLDWAVRYERLRARLPAVFALVLGLFSLALLYSYR